MLLEFTVENFKSFKERTTFSMEATADKKHPDNVTEGEKFKVLKTSMIYGANASGKTKLVEAMAVMRAFVLQSHTHTNEMPLNHSPYAFDKKTIKSPTFFGVRFIKNEILYDYSFSYNADGILNEALKYYPNNRASLIFERNKRDYKFIKDKGKQSSNSERVKDKALYLSVASQFNYSATKEPFEWFLKDLFVIVGKDTGQFLDILIGKMEKEPLFRKRMMKAFKIADLGVVSIKDRNKNKRNPNPMFPGPSIMLKFQDIWLTHNIKHGGNEAQIDLPISQESSGTVMFLSIIGPIIDSLDMGSTIVIDEIDVNFHPDLCKWIIGLFHNPAENSKNAQLIFNTHDAILLDQDLIRRDQVWFVNKDPSSGASKLTSLSEFRERNDKDIKKAYLNGRYDGIPFISSERLME